MKERQYNFRDIFIGILNFFPEESIKYNYNKNFDKFFFNKRR